MCNTHFLDKNKPSILILYFIGYIKIMTLFSILDNIEKIHENWS